MSDRPIGDNAQDYGTTTQFAGAVGTSPVNVPSSPGLPIATVLVRCPNQSPTTRRLSYSFDGGSTYHVLSPGEFIAWSLKGNVTQITLLGNVSGVQYELTLNREPT